MKIKDMVWDGIMLTMIVLAFLWGFAAGLQGGKVEACASMDMYWVGLKDGNSTCMYVDLDSTPDLYLPNYTFDFNNEVAS